MTVDTLLILDNDALFLHVMRGALDSAEYDVITAATPDEAWQIALETPIAVAITG